MGAPRKSVAMGISIKMYFHWNFKLAANWALNSALSLWYRNQKSQLTPTRHLHPNSSTQRHLARRSLELVRRVQELQLRLPNRHRRLDALLTIPCVVHSRRNAGLNHHLHLRPRVLTDYTQRSPLLRSRPYFLLPLYRGWLFRRPLHVRHANV